MADDLHVDPAFVHVAQAQRGEVGDFAAGEVQAAFRAEVDAGEVDEPAGDEVLFEGDRAHRHVSCTSVALSEGGGPAARIR